MLNMNKYQNAVQAALSLCPQLSLEGVNELGRVYSQSQSEDEDNAEFKDVIDEDVFVALASNIAMPLCEDHMSTMRRLFATLQVFTCPVVLTCDRGYKAVVAAGCFEAVLNCVAAPGATLHTDGPHYAQYQSLVDVSRYAARSLETMLLYLNDCSALVESGFFATLLSAT